MYVCMYVCIYMYLFTVLSVVCIQSESDRAVWYRYLVVLMPGRRDGKMWYVHNKMYMYLHVSFSFSSSSS